MFESSKIFDGIKECFDGKCYHFSSLTLQSHDAQTYCKMHNAKLLEIKNNDENVNKFRELCFQIKFN